MSVLPSLTSPAASPSEVLGSLAGRDVGFGTFLGAQLREGAFDAPMMNPLVFGPLPPRLQTDDEFEQLFEQRLETIRRATPGGAVSQDTTDGLRLALQRRRDAARAPYQPVTRAEWESSASFRDGIPWEDGMTVERAAALAERYDDRRFDQWLIENHTGVGFGVSTVTGFMARIAGGAPDPTNFIPFLGPAMRTAAIARLGRVGGRAAIGAAEGALGSALVLPFVAENRYQVGQEFTAADAVLDVVMSAIAGAAFGGVAGALSRRDGTAAFGRTQAPPLLDLRVADEGLAKVQLAMRQITAGQPVDVPDVSAGARRAMLESLSLDERRRVVSATSTTVRAEALTELRRVIAEEQGVPASEGTPLRVSLTADEEAAVRGGTAESRQEARRRFDETQADRTPAQGLVEQARQDLALRNADDAEVRTLAAAGANPIAREAGRQEAIRRGLQLGEDTPRFEPLSPLERMALFDPSERVRNAARSELDRLSFGPRRAGPPAAPDPRPIPSDRATPVPAAATAPERAAGPATGDAAADIDAATVAREIAEEHGIAEDGSFIELDEWQRMEEAGDITPSERAEFEAAEQQLAKTARIREAYSEAAACLLTAAQ